MSIKKFLFSEFTDCEKNIIVKTTTAVINGEFPNHTHDYNELVIISGGTGIHKIGDNEYFLKKGDVFFIHSIIEHSYLECHNLNITNIMFQDHAIEPYIDALKTLSGFMALFHSIPYFENKKTSVNQITLTENDINHVYMLIERILSCYDHMEPGYEIVSVSIFLKIITYISNIYVYYNSQIDMAIKNIARSFTYIENNYLSDINVDKLADMACMSKRNFFRLFKRHFNTTPHDYILKLRINYAAYLLHNTNMTISEVSDLSMFNDSNYFTRCFKRVIGVTPTEYKKQIQ